MSTTREEQVSDPNSLIGGMTRADLMRVIDERLEAEVQAVTATIHRAFPRDESGDVDVDGHRKYHEQMMKAAEAQEEFWREMRLDIAKKGTWGLLVILLGLVLVGLQAKLGGWLPVGR